MIENNKTYGFTIAVKELRETVPNIWRYASAYKRLNNLTSKGLWEMFTEAKPEPEQPELVSDPETLPLPEEILRSDPGRNGLPEIDPEAMEGESYNMCHFWSNFEIARLSFFRSKEYEDFFEMMDRSGGFWMERVCICHDPPRNLFTKLFTNIVSGVMHPSTPSPPAPFSRPATSTTSATLATDTLPSSTARRTRPSADSFRVNRTSRRRRRMSENGSRRTTTGSIGIRPRRTVSDAGAVAILISSMSRAKRAVVWRNGSKLPAVGQAHKSLLMRCSQRSHHRLPLPHMGRLGHGDDRRGS